MILKVNRKKFKELIVQATFKTHGDNYEKKYGHLLFSFFPNCEKFWKYFVIPITKRIEGYPNSLSSNIRPRQLNSPDLEDIANINYSIFINLIYAHLHLNSLLTLLSKGYSQSTPLFSSIEDFYVHLGTTCDLVESFLEKFYFLLLKCLREETEILQKLSREDFLKMAGDWYDKNYFELYEYYFSKGKALPIRIPSRKNIIKEFFSKFFADSDLRKQYLHQSKTIREFRNVIVHDIKVAKIIINNVIFIPKPEKIQKYRTWRDVFSAAGNLEKIQNDFTEPCQQLKNDLETLEIILNKIWNLIITKFNFEFYIRKGAFLREMYKISFKVT